MARLVKHERNKPYRITPEEVKGPIWLCACGLSKNKPYCDSSHKKAQDEQPGEVYVYDDQGRVKVETQY